MIDNKSLDFWKNRVAELEEECVRKQNMIDDLDKTINSKNDEIKQLKHDLDKSTTIHDEFKKEAQDMIAELKSELEAKDNLSKIKSGLLGNFDNLPDEPISVANMLINAKTGYEPTPIQKAFGNVNCIMRDKYSDDDLEQIAEHLFVYCKHKREEYEQ